MDNYECKKRDVRPIRFESYHTLDMLRNKTYDDFITIKISWNNDLGAKFYYETKQWS